LLFWVPLLRKPIEKIGQSLLYQYEDGQFVRAQDLKRPFFNGAAAFADYDQDSDLDLVLWGCEQFGNSQSFCDQVLAFFKWDGSQYVPDAHDEINISDSDRKFHSVTWADYDNDGDEDLLVSGVSAGGTGLTELFENRQGMFVKVWKAEESHGRQIGAQPAWADVDLDGWLDILISGKLTGIPKTFLY